MQTNLKEPLPLAAIRWVQRALDVKKSRFEADPATAPVPASTLSPAPIPVLAPASNPATAPVLLPVSVPAPTPGQEPVSTGSSWFMPAREIQQLQANLDISNMPSHPVSNSNTQKRSCDLMGCSPSPERRVVQRVQVDSPKPGTLPPANQSRLRSQVRFKPKKSFFM
ncbi:hypothetical protein BD289DRAFT_446586 [Coniella lustricola]|uniref:Uncharacterized protein n=1 Tax=Coniella lustricola TaxID=2025994 RepID=A0A2T2ZTS9_9PEZI|nr:hypothetical protein BD289DRAFT_446586 [Coniella lustricola]